MAAGCKVVVHSVEPHVVVVSGEMDYESASDIIKGFDDLVAESGTCDITLDCRKVDSIDSGAIRAIVHSARKLMTSGGTLRLREAPRRVVHALRLSGSAEMLCFESMQAPQDCAAPVEGIFEATGENCFTILMHADPNGVVRKKITTLACLMPFSQTDLDDIALAVGEAISNAIRHGCRDNSKPVSVHCAGDDEKLEISICNFGDRFDPDSIPPPDPMNPREGGMGIFFMKNTMDSVRYEFEESRITVNMIKYIRSDSAKL